MSWCTLALDLIHGMQRMASSSASSGEMSVEAAADLPGGPAAELPDESAADLADAAHSAERERAATAQTCPEQHTDEAHDECQAWHLLRTSLLESYVA